MSGDQEPMVEEPSTTKTTTSQAAAAETPSESPVESDATAVSSTSSDPIAPGTDSLKLAFNSLVHGKRHLLVKDVPSAISSLGEACRLFCELKGTFSSESGEAHFYYGKALLEQARLELNVFEGGPDAEGEAEEDGDDSEEEEEDGEGDAEGEEPEEQGESAMEEVEAPAAEAQAKSPASADVDLNAPSPADNKKAEQISDTPNTNGECAAVVDDEQPSTSSAPPKDKEESDEPTDLELAWEALEVAKTAYIKQIEEVTTNLAKTRSLTELDESTKKTECDDLLAILKSLRRKLADTHIILGEVATESEQYPAAAEDLRTALAILGDIEEPDSRQTAQCYFQLGSTFSYDKKFVESIECFQKSAALIRLRISNLQKLIDTKQTIKDIGASGSDGSYSEEDEIKELESILPELDEKINDTRDAQRDSLKTIEEEKEEQEIIMRNSPVKNPSPVKANDISHLVKKKKKIEEVEVEKEMIIEPPMKKQCIAGVDAPTTNGNCTEVEIEPPVITSNGNGIGKEIGQEEAVPME